METNKNYFLVGLFVIFFVLVGIGFTLWLTSAGKGETVLYRIRFAESVSGLTKESAVKFRGVDVGNVEKIAIDPTDTKLIVVDIRVLKDTPVKTDTTATLKLRGITGDIYIELSGGNPDAPNLADTAKNGEIPEIRAEQSSIDAIVNGLPRLLEKANHIADQIDKMFSPKNVQTVTKVVQGLGSHFGATEKDPNESKGPKEAPYPQYPPQK